MVMLEPGWLHLNRYMAVHLIPVEGYIQNWIAGAIHEWMLRSLPITPEEMPFIGSCIRDLGKGSVKHSSLNIMACALKIDCVYSLLCSTRQLLDVLKVSLGYSFHVINGWSQSENVEGDVQQVVELAYIVTGSLRALERVNKVLKEDW